MPEHLPPLYLQLVWEAVQKAIWRRQGSGLRARHVQRCTARAGPTLSGLRVLNESAAASLAEGLDETLTLHRLKVFAELGVSFRTTNLIESVMARLEAKTHRVTRWKTSDQKLRWCAAALWTAERQFRCVKGLRSLPLLKLALERTLATTKSAAA